MGSLQGVGILDTALSGSLKMKATFCIYKPFTLKIRASLLRFGAQAASQAQGLRE